VKRELAAEAIGSAFLFATVIGSGIMAEKLAGGNVAVALAGNTAATAAILYVLITMLGPLSGAHFNPAVTMVIYLRGGIAAPLALAYVPVQLVGGILGVWAAHAMFELPVLQFSQHVRAGGGQWLGELIATFGLVLTILGTVKTAPQSVPASVALYIAAAYWFTSSTSFANPAITIARSLTDTFSGIAPVNVPAFIAAQIAGALIAHWAGAWLFDGGEAA
jgi:glycerol uptake facilitator-like aquaporin